MRLWREAAKMKEMAFVVRRHLRLCRLLDFISRHDADPDTWQPGGFYRGGCHAR